MTIYLFFPASLTRTMGAVARPANRLWRLENEAQHG